MTKEQAIIQLKRLYNIDYDDTSSLDEYTALIRIRPQNTFLPEWDDFCTPKREAEWVFIDNTEKQDTGLYGSVTYLSDLLWQGTTK